jgi:hypothetical protein
MDPQDPTAPQDITPAPEPNQSDQLTYNDIAPLINAKGWMKFLGILNIIIGILNCLTCIGAIIGWLPIWMGVIIIKASNNLNDATLGNTGSNIFEATQRIKTFFTIYGVLSILILIGMILQTLYFAFIIIMLATGGFAAMQQGGPY